MLLSSISYDWNLNGTLAEAGDVAYGYGPNGLLRSKTGPTSQDDNAFIWDTSMAVSLLLSDETYDFIYAEGATPIAQVERSTGDVEFLHADSLGSVVAKTDEVGAAVATTSFDPYGQGVPISLFGFTGALTDEDSDLVYLRNRWYDPAVGSFLSVDPLLEMTSQAFAYANGNPLLYTDPLGLSPIGDWWGGMSTADKFSTVAAGVGLVALGLVLAPVAVPAAALTGLAVAGFGLSASAGVLYIQDGKYASGLLSFVGAGVGLGAIATSVIRAARATQSAALGVRNVYRFAPGGPSIRRVDTFAQLGSDASAACSVFSTAADFGDSL